METYRKIANYNNYSVSDLGNVRNDETGKLLSKLKDGKGYVRVRLYSNNQWKQFRIHRLVALAFPDICGEYIEGFQVDHINTIKDDNRALNLKWVTASQNRCNPLTIEHFKESTSGEKHHMYGKHHSDESKKKMSESHKGLDGFWKGKKLNDDHKNKLSESHKGKHWKLENGVRVYF